MTEYTGQLIGGPDDGNMVSASVPEYHHAATYRSEIDGPTGRPYVLTVRGVYRWDREAGAFRWRLLGTNHPEDRRPEPTKVRPGRVTDGMVEAFGHGAERHPAELCISDSAIRAGLVAAMTRRELERRTEPELHPINLDPYPATVGEVADEIARYVIELEDGPARGLLGKLLERLEHVLTGLPPEPDPFRQRVDRVATEVLDAYDGEDQGRRIAALGALASLRFAARH